MPTMLLPTFLKSLLQPTTEKARDYRRYSRPGGYDYYQSLKRAAQTRTVQGRTLELAAAQIATIGNAAERQHNLEALHRLDEWLKRRKGHFFVPPSGLMRSPNKILTVKLSPEFGVELKDKRMAVALWSTKDPKLTPTAAGIGVYMMQSVLKLGPFSDCTFHVLDLRENRLYGAASIPNQAAGMLSAEFILAEALLADDEAA